jgi:hypothetical protein
MSAVAIAQHKYLTMSKDLYHHIYDGEIFQKSRCIEQENNLVDFFRNTLTNVGYQSADDSRKVWQRGDKTVVVCLVDDITTCGLDFSLPTPYQFDSNTVVITDNQINCPSQYRVLRLPDTFFGIYSYRPALTDWHPEKRFGFSVNRIDAKRLLLMLEIAGYTPANSNGKILADFEHDNVNFNCWHWSGNNSSDTELKNNFQMTFKELYELSPEQQNRYQWRYSELLKAMPIKNYTQSPEHMLLNNWLNLVVETYSGSDIVAISEKTFRALTTPAPWMLFSGRYTIAYLKQLGFDVLDDLVNHRYDYCEPDNTNVIDNKIIEFVNIAQEVVDSLKQKDMSELQERCLRAATHNQNLLASMRLSWPSDFAAWLPSVVKDISD